MVLGVPILKHIRVSDPDSATVIEAYVKLAL